MGLQPPTKQVRKQVKRNAANLQELNDRDNRVFRRISSNPIGGTGGAGGGTKRAVCNEDAPAGNIITANFFDGEGVEITTGEDGVDFNIPIYCNISDGSDLSDSTRLLYENDEIFVETDTVDVAGTPTQRWFCVEGFQGNPNGSRRAVCSANAGGGSTIAANLKSLVNGTSNTAITVNCNISNGTALNEAIPLLEIGDTIMVAKSKTGASTYAWYCLSNFHSFEECVCEEPA